METQKEIEVRKDSFRKWRDNMLDAIVWKDSNRIGKNLSYFAYMSAWQHSRIKLLKEIIDSLEFESYEQVVKNIYKKYDDIQ